MTDPAAAPGSYAPQLPPLAAFGGAPLYVTGEDALMATVLNGAAGVTVTISGRMLEFGTMRSTPFAQSIVPATDRTASVVRFSIGDGWLLNAQAIITGGTPASGQTFVRLSLVRGLTSVAGELFTLFAGYVTAKLPQSYPGSGIAASTDGCGALRSITGATPAAGAEISESVPTGARWELLAFVAKLSASAAVANRQVRLTLDDGANVFFQNLNTFAETASQVITYAYIQNTSLGQLLTVDQVVSVIPGNVRLGAGHRIRTTTLGIQGADQWSLVQYLVREWIEGA